MEGRDRIGDCSGFSFDQEESSDRHMQAWKGKDLGVLEASNHGEEVSRFYSQNSVARDMCKNLSASFSLLIYSFPGLGQIIWSLFLHSVI